MNYQGFQNSLQKRFATGLEFLVSYTWSHAMADNAGYYSTSLNSTANPQDYGNLRGTWGPASMDARHSFVTSSNYELPFGRGRSLFAQAPRAVNAVIGGWRLSGVLTLRTGMPLTIVETPDTSNTGSVAPRPNLISNPNLGSAASPAYVVQHRRIRAAGAEHLGKFGERRSSHAGGQESGPVAREADSRSSRRNIWNSARRCST